jgi:hypothetical protein
MITPKGVALIAELIAAAWLIAGLFGFAVWRSKIWFACTAAAAAATALIVAVTALIDLST